MDQKSQRIAFRGTLTKADWYLAAAMIRKSSNLIDPRILVGLMFLFSGWLLVFWWRSSNTGLLLPATLAAYVGWSQWSYTWRNWRLLQPRVEESGVFSSEGIEAASTIASTNWKWSAILRHFWGPSILVLQAGPRLFLIFPRHFFASDEDWRDVCELVDVAHPQPAKPSSLFTQLPPGEKRWLFWLKQLLLWAVIFAFIVRLWTWTLEL